MRKVLFILAELDDSDIDWLVAQGEKRRYPAGATLIEEGKPISVLFILLDGKLSVRLNALGDREVATLRSGEVLGELSFLDARPPSATVKAIEEATVLAVSREQLSTKLSADSAFAARFYRALGVFLAARLRRTQERLGYGPEKLSGEASSRMTDEELDPERLESVALAGARFEWLLTRLRSAPAASGGSGGVHGG